MGTLREMRESVSGRESVGDLTPTAPPRPSSASAASPARAAEPAPQPQGGAAAAAAAGAGAHYAQALEDALSAILDCCASGSEMAQAGVINS